MSFFLLFLQNFLSLIGVLVFVLGGAVVVVGSVRRYSSWLDKRTSAPAGYWGWMLIVLFGLFSLAFMMTVSAK